MASIEVLKHNPVSSDYEKEKISAFDPDLEFDRWREQASAALPVPSQRIIAHMFGDSFIQNSPLEGLSLKESVQFLLASLQAEVQGKYIYPFSKRDEAIQKLKQILYWEEKIEEARKAENLHEALTLIAEEIIEKLQTEGSILLPGGWIALKCGHAMLYSAEIEPSKKTYSFTVMNTGDGIHLHALKIFDTKLKYQFTRKIEKINEHVISHPEFFVRLLGYRSFIPDTLQKAHSAKDIFYFLENMLGKKLALSGDEPDEAYITKQQSGTCAWKVIMNLLRQLVPINEYRKFKCTLHLHNLSFWLAVCQKEPYCESNYNLLRDSANAFKKFVKKTKALDWLDVSEQWNVSSLLFRVEQTEVHVRFQASKAKQKVTPPLPCRLHDVAVALGKQLSAAPPAQTLESLCSCIKGYVDYATKLYREQRTILLQDFCQKAFDTFPLVHEGAFWEKIAKEDLDSLIKDIFAFSTFYGEVVASDANGVANRLYLYRTLEVLVQRAIFLETGSDLLPANFFNLPLDFAERCTVREPLAQFRLQKLCAESPDSIFHGRAIGNFHWKENRLEIVFLKITCAASRFLDSYLEKKGTLVETRKKDPDYVVKAFTEDTYLPECFKLLQHQFFTMVCGAKVIDKHTTFILNEEKSSRAAQCFSLKISSNDQETFVLSPDIFFHAAKAKLFTSSCTQKEKDFYSSCQSAPYVTIPALLDYFEQDLKLFSRPEMRELFLDLLVQFDKEVSSQIPHGTESASILTLELHFDTDGSFLKRLSALMQALKAEADSLDSHLFILTLERTIFGHTKRKFASVYTLDGMRELFFRYRYESQGVIFKEFIAWHKRQISTFDDYMPDLLYMLASHALNPSLERATMALFLEIALADDALKQKLEEQSSDDLVELFTTIFEETAPHLEHDHNWELAYPVVSSDRVTFNLRSLIVTYCGELYVDIHYLVAQQAGYKAVTQNRACRDFVPQEKKYVSQDFGISVASLASSFVFSIQGQKLVEKLGDFGPKLSDAVEVASVYLYIDPSAQCKSEELRELDFPLDAFAYTLQQSRFERYRSLDEDNPHLVLYDPVDKSCYVSVYSHDRYITIDLTTKLHFSWLSDCRTLDTYAEKIQEIEIAVHIQLWVDRRREPNLLEFPRHGLSFTIEARESKLIFWSKEHPGYFWDITSVRTIKELPGTLLLQNEENKPLLLVPDLEWQKVSDPKEPFSRRLLFTVPKGYAVDIRYLECMQTKDAKGKIRLAHIHVIAGNCGIAKEILSACYQNKNVSQDQIQELISLIKDKRATTPNQIALKLHAAWLLCEATKLSFTHGDLVGALHVEYSRNLPNISKAYLLPSTHEMVIIRSITNRQFYQSKRICQIKQCAYSVGAPTQFQIDWTVAHLPQDPSYIQEFPSFEFKASYYPEYDIEKVFFAFLRKLLVAAATNDKTEVVRMMIKTHHFKGKKGDVQQTCLLLARKILQDTPLITLSEEELALYRQDTPLSELAEALNTTYYSNIKAIKARKMREKMFSKENKKPFFIAQYESSDFMKLEHLQEAQMAIDQVVTRCFQ